MEPITANNVENDPMLATVMAADGYGPLSLGSRCASQAIAELYRTWDDMDAVDCKHEDRLKDIQNVIDILQAFKDNGTKDEKILDPSRLKISS